jgi:molybdopterin-guanine dinucleotide biosynthesis protein A
VRIPPILCVIGHSGSGKTHLLERLIGRLAGEGLRVAAVKHCRHVDRRASGKDSDRLSRAGASPAIAAGGGAVDVNGGGEPLLPDLVAAFCRDCDLVLAEGYRRSVHDKVAVRAGDGSRPPGAGGVRLTVTSDEADAAARWLLAWIDRRRALREGLLGAVLTGGASRRMGSDKASLRVAGRRVLGGLCALLADRLGEVVIVGREPDWDGIPACAAWHPDARANLGPLGGIATALRIAAAGARPRALCAVACDMPALAGGLLDHLLDGRDTHAAATALVSPATHRPDPFPAIYEPSAAASIERALGAGELSVTAWLAASGARRLAVPGELAGQMGSANTPEELAAAARELEEEELTP